MQILVEPTTTHYPHLAPLRSQYPFGPDEINIPAPSLMFIPILLFLIVRLTFPMSTLPYFTLPCLPSIALHLSSALVHPLTLPLPSVRRCAMADLHSRDIAGRRQTRIYNNTSVTITTAIATTTSTTTIPIL